jgi:hypothetical protein
MYIIAIFPTADNNAIKLAIPNYRIKSADKLGAMATPAGAKVIFLLPWRTAIVYTQDPGWAVGVKMCTCRARHQPQPPYVSKP